MSNFIFTLEKSCSPGNDCQDHLNTLAFPSVLDVLSRYKEQISGINHRIRKERRKGPCLFDVEGRFCKQEFVFFPVCVSLVQLLKKETEREIQRPVTVAMLYVHFSWTYRAPLRVVVFFVPLFPLEWLFFIHFYVESFFWLHLLLTSLISGRKFHMTWTRETGRTCFYNQESDSTSLYL